MEHNSNVLLAKMSCIVCLTVPLSVLNCCHAQLLLFVQQQQQQRHDTPEDGRWMLPMEFHYLSEFQAHQPDFDYLKSIEIPEKINSISWLHNCGTTHMLLSANDKQVKLWKVRSDIAVD
jgi:hypothetical protein